jgi:hypothetical protein
LVPRGLGAIQHQGFVWIEREEGAPFWGRFLSKRRLYNI